MNIEIKKIEKEKAWKIRHQVMWPDRPFDYIKVTDDHLALHYGLFKAQALISVISLFITDEEAQFRKFATVDLEQGKGFGSSLLEFTLEQAKHQGVKRIWCNARTNKLSFYKKFGFKETDSHFTRGGKQYIIMERYLY